MAAQIIIATLFVLALIVGATHFFFIALPQRKQAKAWEKYVDNKVLETIDQFDTNPELTWNDRMTLMQDTLADLYIELYKNVKNKAVRIPMMQYITSYENKLVNV